jgi:ribonuclease HIII
MTFLRESGIEVTGRREVDYGTQYFLSRGPEAANLTVYRTGRVVVGGKPASGVRREIEGYLPRAGHRVVPATRKGPARPALDATRRLGIDEAGKGDYFGPMVVAGVRILGEPAARELQEIGVRDSKDLSVAQAARFADRIMRSLGPENCRMVSLSPREFERHRTTAGNVNLLLGEIGAQIIGELGDEVETVVVDEFARAARSYLEPSVPDGVRLEVRRRADSDDAAVAAASILARARYLEDLESLSEEVGFELPKGSTHVIAVARRIVEERGIEGLGDVAKVSFRTTEKVLRGSGGGL